MERWSDVKGYDEIVNNNPLTILGKDANDLTAKKYNKLLPIYPTRRVKKRIHWICICDCGKYAVVESSKLVSGHTTSCGCNKTTRNGLSDTRLYDIWRGMNRRCHNIKNSQYNYYGARGIKVCNEWRYNFNKFYNWAIDNGYKDDLTIDRINNNGNYKPSNCKWTTMIEQANNRRSNNKLTYRGVTLPKAKWSTLLGWGTYHSNI